MLKLGTQDIAAMRLGGQEIKRAYLGESLVFDLGYTITVSIDPAGSGTVTGAGQYQEGEDVTVLATPGDGYKFTGWQEDGQTVSTDAEYSFTATANRTLTAVFAVVSVSRLPEGYTEVEYIQSSGTQYINTGVGQSSLMKFVIDYEVIAFGGSSQYPSCSIFYSSSPILYGYSYAFIANQYQDEIVIQCGYTRNSYRNAAKVSGMPRRLSLTVDRPNLTIDISGEPTVKMVENNGANSNSMIYLLGYITSSPAFGSTRLYSCQIDADGVGVRDFVPCIDPSGAVGLYDLATDAFYGNSGSGAFAAGPAV